MKAGVEALLQGRRMLVMGSPGSGKTTFAKRLATLTGLPCVSLDDLYWGSNWVRPSDSAFRERLEQAMRADGWILDGNFHDRYLNLRLERADTILFLDVPTRVAVTAVVRRAVGRYLGDKSTLPAGVAVDSSYRPRWELTPRFLWKALSFRRTVRPVLLPRLAELTGRKSVLILGSRDVATALLEAVPSKHATD